MRPSALALTVLGIFSLLWGKVDAQSLIYRGDTRGPLEIQNENPPGFKAWGYDNQEVLNNDNIITLKSHLGESVEQRPNDPWVATSLERKKAARLCMPPLNKNADGVGWLYTLDAAKIPERMVDATRYLARYGMTENPYAPEKEIAVKRFIPWAAVVKVERVFNGRATEVTAPRWGEGDTVKAQANEPSSVARPAASTKPASKTKSDAKPKPAVTPKPQKAGKKKSSRDFSSGESGEAEVDSSVDRATEDAEDTSSNTGDKTE